MRRKFCLFLIVLGLLLGGCLPATNPTVRVSGEFTVQAISAETK